ncbi:lipopolysaccharide-binding -like isoform X2 [Labeo rohita]|uniref:Bactericidal permeability-increasing protein n=1 Tax=Labeo rohita TaxID=84645 RepID=A0A498LGL9_LABRO|nr:lipopolysaccharide-binding -like isoform X2 [Labeo rohita]
MQVVICFLMILTHTYADYPALKTVLSEKGLRDVSQMMAVWIQSKLKSTTIPEVHGGVDIGIGTVHYVISNHDGGSLDLAVYNIKIQTLLELGDDTGRVSITTVSCSDGIGGVNIQFHGGARSGTIDVHVLAAAKFSVVKPDGMLVPLFRLDVDGSFSGSALIDKKHLTGAFNMKKVLQSAALQLPYQTVMQLVSTLSVVSL